MNNTGGHETELQEMSTDKKTGLCCLRAYAALRSKKPEKEEKKKKE